jgi:hypothetical protein
MRIRLLAVPAATVGACLIVPAAAAQAPPGASYQWAQPGCAPVASPYSQPRVSFTAPAQVVLASPAVTAYFWAQPGSAPVQVPDAQPW